MSETHGMGPPISGNAGPSWPLEGFTSGDPDVDGILQRLARLWDAPATEQAELYSGISDSLLAELNQGRQA